MDGKGVSGGGVEECGGRVVPYLNVGEGGKLHDGASKGPEGVLHVECEAEALAEQELAGENVFGVLFTKCLGKPGSSSSAA